MIRSSLRHLARLTGGSGQSTPPGTIRNVAIPPQDWRPQEAHKGPVLPNPNSLVWQVIATRTAREANAQDSIHGSNPRIHEDKLYGMKKLADLVKEKKVVLSSNQLVLVEGADQAKEIPGFYSSLNLRSAPLFLTDTSSMMVDRAAKVAHRFLGKDAAIFASVCNAFQGPPSELARFPDAQKLVLPFRMGIVAGHKDLTVFLRERARLIRENDGVILLSVLKKDEGQNLQTILEEVPVHRIDPRGSNANYTEVFRTFGPQFLDRVIERRLYARLLNKNPSDKTPLKTLKKRGELEALKKEERRIIESEIFQDPSAPAKTQFACPAVTLFKERGVHELISDAGLTLIEPTDRLDNSLVHSTTDLGKDLRIWVLICKAKKGTV